MNASIRWTIFCTVLWAAPLLAKTSNEVLKSEYENDLLQNVSRKCSEKLVADDGSWIIGVKAMKMTFETSNGTPHQHFRATVSALHSLHRGATTSYVAFDYDDERAWEPPFDFNANPIQTGFRIRFGPDALIDEENAEYFKANPLGTLNAFATVSERSGHDKRRVDGWLLEKRAEWRDKGLWRQSMEWNRFSKPESRKVWLFVGKLTAQRTPEYLEIETGYEDWYGNERIVVKDLVRVEGLGERIEDLVREAYFQADSSNASDCGDGSGFDSFSLRLYH